MKARAGGEGNDELSPDFLDFIACLDEQQVDFVLVGAYALGVHGVVRATGGLDELKKNKRATGRKKDKDDLRQLDSRR